MLHIWPLTAACSSCGGTCQCGMRNFWQRTSWLAMRGSMEAAHMSSGSNTACKAGITGCHHRCGQWPVAHSQCLQLADASPAPSARGQKHYMYFGLLYLAPRLLESAQPGHSALDPPNNAVSPGAALPALSLKTLCCQQYGKCKGALPSSRAGSILWMEAGQ